VNPFSDPEGARLPEIPSETPKEFATELESNSELALEESHLKVSDEKFKLPPLALDSSKDVFRELWPRVTSELNHLLREVPSAQQVAVEEQPEMVQRHETGLTSLAGGSLALIQTPLSSEALLRRPNEPQVEVNQGMSTSRLLEAILGARSPTPSRAIVAANRSELGCDETATEKPSRELMAKFVSDVTVNDGQLFPPGAEFVKAWRMLNNGSSDWPKSTRLVFVAGDQLTRDRSVPEAVEVGSVSVGAEVELWTGELKAPEVTGKYVGYWKLEDGQGNLFGESVWIEVTVADIEHSGSSGEESLASSSIIMPQPALSIEPERNSPPSTISPVTAPSSPRSEGTRMGSGSTASLISFISGSEDEDDAAMWEDVRSHANTTTEGQHAGAPAATEYVVLYDEVSSEDGW
jgi:next-to-BRCA1 protein 1